MFAFDRCTCQLQVSFIRLFLLLGIRDSNLKLTLAFGVGIHHAGLHEKDRAVVEELFLNQKTQVRPNIIYFIRSSSSSSPPPPPLSCYFFYFFLLSSAISSSFGLQPSSNFPFLNLIIIIIIIFIIIIIIIFIIIIIIIITLSFSP